MTKSELATGIRIGFNQPISSEIKIFISALVGIGIGMLVGFLLKWEFAPMAAWDSGALLFLLWTWLTMYGRTGQETEAVASKENLGRLATDVMVLLACVVSLVGVLVLLFQATDATGTERLLLVSFAIISVVISWTTVHTVFTLKYTRLFYGADKGIDFNGEKKPRYSDFAYVAFTIGMTFQVSDNGFQTNEFRRIALRHAVLSYMFGTVIVATAINLIAGLGK